MSRIVQLAVLGSTGSVGTSTLEVVRHFPERLKVVALAAYGTRLDELVAQVGEFRPLLVAVWDPEGAAELRRRVSSATRVVSGDAGLHEVVTHPEVDRVVAAMVGAAGLVPTHRALVAGKDVALANKEALVVAGGLMTAAAREAGVRILPVDSEHAALHQALRGGQRREVSRLVLTASGGPFLRRDAASWDSIRPEEAVAHPTWEMGHKISVDSATLMNKGLELIEAAHLFGLPADRISAVVHPQSLVHALVEFRDGTWLAQLSANDMVFPVQYALTYPERWGNEFARLEPADLGQLAFEPVDHERFPALTLARRAMAVGASGPAVLNGANEAAVRAFLTERIPFPAIVETVSEVLEQHRGEAVSSIAEALAWDRWGRERAEMRFKARGW